MLRTVRQRTPKREPHLLRTVPHANVAQDRRLEFSFPRLLARRMTKRSLDARDFRHVGKRAGHGAVIRRLVLLGGRQQADRPRRDETNHFAVGEHFLPIPPC